MRIDETRPPIAHEGQIGLVDRLVLDDHEEPLARGVDGDDLGSLFERFSAEHWHRHADIDLAVRDSDSRGPHMPRRIHPGELVVTEPAVVAPDHR